MKAYRILLVDDHELLTSLFRSLLESQYPDQFQAISTAKSGEEALALCSEQDFDLVAMDVNMPGMNGAQTTKALLKEKPGLKVVALSSQTDKKQVIQMLQAGVKGYLLKNDPFGEILNGFLTILINNQIYLSPSFGPSILGEILQELLSCNKPVEEDLLTKREEYILTRVAKGDSSKQIATALNLSVRTVEKYRLQIIRKTGVKDLPGLTKIALRMGLIALE